jgi:probable rRNA maturation factor
MICDFYSLVKIPAKFKAKFAAKVVAATARELKLKENGEVTVMVVSPAYIKKLNQQYRHKNKVTDVLSFSQKEGLEIKLPAIQKVYYGDIILCFAQVKKQAKLFRHNIDEEYALLIIHGFLHLLGYKDDTDQQYQKMAKIQDRVLTKIYGKNKQIS